MKEVVRVMKFAAGLEKYHLLKDISEFKLTK
jgi:hypothetical protein